LAKNIEQREALESTIYCCIQCIQYLALIASPLIPTSAQKIWEEIGFSTDLEKGNWALIRDRKIPSGQKLPEPVILFRKVEDEEILEQIAKLGASKSLHKEMVVKTSYPIQTELSFEPVKPEIMFDQFGKIDLRVAQIIEAVKVPKSKKLLKLLVDVGFEKRTIVSGIALYYEPEQLIGKKVVIVANLAPATIMGIESRGMVLAASMGTSLELPHIQNLLPGSVIS